MKDRLRRTSWLARVVVGFYLVFAMMMVFGWYGMLLGLALCAAGDLWLGSPPR